MTKECSSIQKVWEDGDGANGVAGRVVGGAGYLKMAVVVRRFNCSGLT